MPHDPHDNQPEEEAGEHAASGDNDVAKRRTLAEAADALDVHLVTLQRWMRQADIAPERDDVDRRFKWLSERDVMRLGQLHHRTLRDQPRREHVSARLRDCERRIEELEATVEELRQQLESRGGSANQPQNIPETIPYEPFAPRRAPVRTRPLGPITTLDEVPAGWVPWRRLAGEWGIPLRTFENAVEKGRIPIVRGEWRTAGLRPVLVRELLDEAGQEAARRYFGK